MSVLEQFLSVIRDQNMLQSKYLQSFLPSLTDPELEDLENLIRFYQSQGHSIEKIADCYLFFIQMVMEETMYFAKHGTYRYSSFKEVSKDVYFNPEYMTKYMIGLALSQYLLNNHLDNMRFFLNFIKNVKGTSYLEIGPGHGEYFVKAIKLSHLKNFYAVDLSQTSVDLTKKYIQFCGLSAKENIRVEQGDFFDFNSSQKYDVMVMGEVLEHVERPRAFLEQIAKLSHEGSRSYVTTVVDAPARDHIYHFHTVDEIFDLVKSAGLRITDYNLVTYNREPIEKAEKKHRAIIVAMVLGAGHQRGV